MPLLLLPIWFPKEKERLIIKYNYDIIVTNKYMIIKFEKNDMNDVLQLWKIENIKAHQFIPKEYWENNYNFVKGKKKL